MSTNIISARPSAEALQAAVTKLAKLESRWRKSERKHALCRYLEAVFDLYSEWKNAGDVRTVANRFARRAGVTVKHGIHPLRTIIDSTSNADRKSKSRWTQALRYAWRQRREWQNVYECFRANGGISGCARKFADMQPMRTPPGCVRVGGEDRVPKIGFFVGKSLLDQYGEYR